MIPTLIPQSHRPRHGNFRISVENSRVEVQNVPCVDLFFTYAWCFFIMGSKHVLADMAPANALSGTLVETSNSKQEQKFLALARMFFVPEFGRRFQHSDNTLGI